MTKIDKEKYQGLLKEVGDSDKAYDLWLRWKCLTDLYFFGAEFLGWKDAKNRSGHKKRIDPKFHRWLAKVVQADDDTLCLVPRGHLKSTWTKLRIVQLILLNPNTRILLCSVTSRLVERELSDIKSILSSPQLRRVFDEVPDPGKDYINWAKSTANELTIFRDQSLGKIPQEPQVLAVGMGAKITGFHFDWAFLDDVVDDSNVTTIDQMEKVEDWWSYLAPILEAEAVTVIIGTRYHMNDLYGLLISEKQFKRVFTRRCIENGEPIYKSWYSIASLKKLRRRMRDDWKFNCQYNNDPHPDSAKIFQPPFLTFKHLPPGKYTYYMSVDPAATTNVHSDFSAICIAAVSETNWLYIVECAQYKVPGNKLADAIIQKVLQYQPLRVGIEFGLQEHLRHIIDFKVREWESANRSPKLGVLNNILPIKISREKSKSQRIAASLGAFIRERKCLIHESQRDLMKQMEFFTGAGKEHDDLVDAASMIFSVSDKFALHYWIEPQFRQKGYTMEDFKVKQAVGWEQTSLLDLYSKLLSLTRSPEDLKSLMSLLSERPRTRTAVSPYRRGMKGNIQALKSPPERRV